MHPSYAPGSVKTMKALVERYVAVPAEEWSRFVAMLQERDLPKRRHLLQIGQVSGELAFVTRGLVRRYARSKGREVNVALLPEGSFANGFASFVEQQPSSLAIQAIEDTHLLTLSYTAVCALSDGNPCWHQVGLRAAVDKLRQKTEREAALIAQSAEERYERLLQAWSDVELRVPQYHIASYLGVSPETLSRLRRRRARRGG